MKRIHSTYYSLFFFCTLLFATILSVRAQETPAGINISWVDTSQFPQMEVYLVATAANGGRFPGLFADVVELYEDGAERTPSLYDAPRGTALTFLIDADEVAGSSWDGIREAIEGYASISWMDEDLDTVTLIVANGQEKEMLVEQASFHNTVSNAFINQSGNYFEPSVRPGTPLNDLLQETLTSMRDEALYRGLVLFSSGDTAGSAQSVDGVAAMAREQNIPLFTVLVGDSPVGEQTLQQLANNSGGQFYRLAGSGSLASLWEVLSSHRQQYTISYRSQIVSSGPHVVKVQMADNLSAAHTFEITVLAPEVEITLPESNAAIQRQLPESGGDNYEPKTQAVKYLWAWPDEHERQVHTVQLRVNGAVQQQLDLTTSNDRNLVWNMDTLPAGPYSLRVEVIDELGMKGQSPEIPVTIEMIDAAVEDTPTPVATATPAEPSLFASLYETLSKALDGLRRNLGCLSVSGLSLAAILASIYVFQRRMTSMGRDPISFVRRLPIFRPIDGFLRLIERFTGPIRMPRFKRKKKGEKGIARVEVIAGQASVKDPIEIKTNITFGRSREQAQVVFSDRTLSRRHAEIAREHGDKYRIYNYSSQNTWVNEQHVPEHGLLLNNGDVIRMGKVQIRFYRK